jgi:hypothetical protein
MRSRECLAAFIRQEAGHRPRGEGRRSILEAAGCYEARNQAVREVVPEFEPTMPWKIVLASDRLSSEVLHFFKVVVRLASGEERQ